MSRVLSSGEIRKVNLTGIKQMALEAKQEIWDAARRSGRDAKIYLHWSAGRYGQFWDDYHVQIDQDGSLYVPASITFASVLQSTYYRNSGSVSIGILGCFGATTNGGLGSNPPTQAQIDTMARAVAVVADALDLTINIRCVMTHGEAADNEDGYDPGYADPTGHAQNIYGPKASCERWDLEYLGTSESPAYDPWATDGSRGGDVLRGKANWYKNTYKDGVERHFS